MLSLNIIFLCLYSMISAYLKNTFYCIVPALNV